jgi:hypothetical protein
MKIYLAIGLICFLSISVFAGGWVTPRDDNRVPASVIVDRDGNFLVINADGSMYVILTTNSVILSILKPVTTYMTISQFEELAKNATSFLTISQFNELNESIDNIYSQILSSVTTVEKKYLNKVSTGTSGKITATTSQQIVISNNVTEFQFTFINTVDGSAEATVTSSHDGDKMYFYDGFWKVISVNVPQPITFDVTMPVTSTFTYEVQEVE